MRQRCSASSNAAPSIQSGRKKGHLPLRVRMAAAQQHGARRRAFCPAGELVRLRRREKGAVRDFGAFLHSRARFAARRSSSPFIDSKPAFRLLSCGPRRAPAHHVADLRHDPVCLRAELAGARAPDAAAERGQGISGRSSRRAPRRSSRCRGPVFGYRCRRSRSLRVHHADAVVAGLLAGAVPSPRSRRTRARRRCR